MSDPLLERDPARTDAETCEQFIGRAFGGDRRRYEEFLETVRAAIPPDVAVIVRGSSVTGVRNEDGAPFDADGPGTSDVDLTFVGGDMVKLYDSFHIPGIHSVPMGEDHPDAAPTLAPLREKLCALAGRPVNIQATTDIVQYVRDVTMNQPYFVLLTRRDGGPAEEPPHAGAVRAPVPEAGPVPTLGPL
ncbi:MAG: hypothetical protein JO180_04370 [Gemmatirosa sp.]|nr:hypothetical protein [Gemmatirosa sp.]